MALPLLVKAALIGAAAYAVARAVKSQQPASAVYAGGELSMPQDQMIDEHPWPTSSTVGPTS